MRKSLLLLSILLVVNTLFRINSISLPLDRDEGAYAYIGWQWLAHNTIPYAEVFDHKAPLIYLPFGISTYFFGHSELYIRLFIILYSTAITVCLYKICRKNTSLKISFWSSLIGIMTLGSGFLEGDRLQPETLILLPICLIIDRLTNKKSQVVRQSHYFELGLLFGLILSLKLSMVFLVIFLTLYIFHKKPSFIQVVHFLCGCILIPILVATYFVVTNTTSTAFYSIVTYNLYYVADAKYSLGICAGRESSQLACIFSWVIQFNIFIFPLMIVSLFGALVTIKSANSKLLLLIFLGTFMATKGSGGRDYLHYYLLWGPPLIILLSHTLKTVSTYLKRSTTPTILSLLVWLGTLNTIYLLILHNPNSTSVQDQIWNDVKKIGELTKRHVSKIDNLYVWTNEPQVYYYSKTGAYNSDINFFNYSLNEKTANIKKDELLSNPPQWIVTPIQPVCENNYFYRNIESAMLIPFSWLNTHYQVVERSAYFALYKRIK